MTSIPPGPKCCSIRQYLNLHKALVVPCYLIFYFIFGQNLDSDQKDRFIELSIMHGSYGIMWILKGNFDSYFLTALIGQKGIQVGAQDRPSSFRCFGGNPSCSIIPLKDIHFPDASWQAPATLPSAIIGFISMGIFYYLPGISLTKPIGLDYFFIFESKSWQFAGWAVYIWGVFLHFVTDAEKYYILKYQVERKLITEGMMEYSRNMNYFGEILIYLGFAFMSTSALPLIFSSFMWLTNFVPRMMMKDSSMSRHPEWEEWSKRAWILFPNPVIVIKNFPKWFSK